MKNEDKILEKTIKKSSIIAKDIYDYERIEYSNQCLVSCTLKEEMEDIVVTYDVNHLLAYSDIGKQDILMKLGILSGLYKIYETRQEYVFNISPDNLMYDRNGQLKVLDRDVYDRGETFDADSFLTEVKALIGHTMQKKYTYEDYVNGGLELLLKDSFLEDIYNAKNIEDVIEKIEEKYELEQENILKNVTKVNKKKYSLYKRGYIFASILLVASIAYIVYITVTRINVDTSIKQSYEAYLEEDYVKVIDTLADVSLERLNANEKYILAEAYVKGENLTSEQKNNILAKLVPTGDVNVMNYWIYLGRLNVSEAENIALQRSDDELLLYAYMKEKSLIELDDALTGEEKSQSLEDIQGKIDKLATQYEEEENK